ncbi:autotransporter outer membrane beta-barrel domain-containing protein [Neotamlana laminarinivorans]|uniref:Uncharacterized protein n=1 Tax=Neotamlana laminarinivorans TaxID=2883124 RepID=A0A9X1I4G7_9FLAO|nr:hypothetical protein [Tamlana laminarinivorans]MCB4799824.1 hypothetical protein [Tamlana laminarinivorans]
MKKSFLTFLTASALIFTGCLQDDDTPIVIEEVTNNYYNDGDTDGDTDYETIVVSGGIALDDTWTADNVYVLDRKVVVQEGVTLTIEPGTIIKGRAGTGSLSSALIIARGAQINAVGTADAPIIFTSESDEIEPGETSGPNLDESHRGLWGGIIMLGKATISVAGDTGLANIEGIAADDTFGLYGVDLEAGESFDDADSSGTLQYVSIRHGGALLGEGNEINGLTLGGVGSGTTIDNVEVVANVDDGIEFFGGTVNASNLLVWAQGDDALDIDQAYSGTITNAVVILGDASDHGLEIDGPEGSLDGEFTINDLTMIGNTTTANGEYADWRSNAQGHVNNVYAYGFKDSSDVELDNDGVATNYNAGLVTMSNWEIVLPSGVTDVTSIFKNNAETVTVTGLGSEATAVTQGSQTVGATTTVLGWTYTAENVDF